MSLRRILRFFALLLLVSCSAFGADPAMQEWRDPKGATFKGEPVRSPFMPDGFAKQAVALVNQQEESSGGGLSLLTDREHEILACAAAGRSNKEIADQLCVSLDTVKTHLHHIYQKLRVSGRVEAVLTYLQSR
jgi:DNA-binding CsgD family transcriptional regulator